MTETAATIRWAGDHVRLIDQTRLPREQRYLDVRAWQDMVTAIQKLQVRGAPALGVAGAFGLVLAAQEISAANKADFLAQLRPIAQALAQARPTAVNLSWAVRGSMSLLDQTEVEDPSQLCALLLTEAQRVLDEDIAANRAMGAHGAALLPQDCTVLTHCNAGALATAGYGTALGVIRAAREAGKSVRVYADETRPLLQGARLTAWELVEDGFDVTLITDTMAGHFLHSGIISCVVVGADRIAANGDVANKIGTYGVAVLAKENNVPFYVAAPTSTVDLTLASGSEIPIEERRPEEVTHFAEIPIAPEGVSVANPAFDVTPARYVTAIITERGVVHPTYEGKLHALLQAKPGSSS